MRIAVIDDKEYWRELASNKIKQYYKGKNVEIDMYEDGISYLKSGQQYDISFVDIEMAGLDGFDTISEARKNNQDGIYIILTTHAELSRKGYRVNAFRYIDKTELDEIPEAIKSAELLMGRNETIAVNVIDAGKLEIMLKNIIYIETEKHYVVIHATHGDIKCSDQITDIENMLAGKWFYRCHKPSIVNLDEIRSIKNYKANMSNGASVEVSRRKVPILRREYVKRNYECANA